MTSTRIEEIRQRAEAATKGPNELSREVASIADPIALEMVEGALDAAFTSGDYARIDPLALQWVLNALSAARETITKLEERCEGYKGQVKAGGEEIERLRAEREELVKALVEALTLAEPWVRNAVTRNRVQAHAKEEVLKYIRSALVPVLNGGEWQDIATPIDAVKAIEFAFAVDDLHEMRDFLDMWRHGDWEQLRENWPEAFSAPSQENPQGNEGER